MECALMEKQVRSEFYSFLRKAEKNMADSTTMLAMAVFSEKRYFALKSLCVDMVNPLVGNPKSSD